MSSQSTLALFSLSLISMGSWGMPTPMIMKFTVVSTLVLYTVTVSERYIRDINSWMQGMKLKMNNSNIEYIIIGTPQQLATCTNTAIDIGGYEAHARNCVRNLGAYFNKHMSMEEHVKLKCRAAYELKCRAAYELKCRAAYELKCRAAYELKCRAAYELKCRAAYELKCRAAYELKFRAAYELKCRAAYELKCRAAYELKCRAAYEFKCRAAYEFKCRAAYELKCRAAYELKCRAAYEFKCRAAYEFKCRAAYELKCRAAYELKCRAAYELKCRAAYEFKCRAAYEFKCRAAYEFKCRAAYEFKCRAAYVQLYNIGKIRKYLDQQNTEKLIYALVYIHIDYCNALLIGLPKYLIRKLQMVQNTAARVLCRIGKYDYITPVLKSLHWLPVEFRIKYKICLLTFNSLHGHGPEYMLERLTPRSTHCGLRSQDDLKLDVPRTKRKTLGDRAFKVAASKLWNSLPKDVRSCNNASIFKSKLKTHYFRIAYN